ncbi:MAG: carboxypeptidase-like regulatory domain-containing protein [Ignavibacteria bacterium]|nr:carboxypeptidase-like regulatory domain-containing protein [Ignavibacteria bacterium]
MFKHISKLIFILTIFSSISIAQENLTGYIYGESEGKKTALEDAVVKWINTTKGTLTDPTGKFSLSLNGISDKRLVVSYTGYKTDTVDAADKQSVEVTLLPNTQTSTINVEDNKKSSYFGNFTAKTEVISSQELVKESCCDLSGCFGRNSSVEVAVTDIITDAKELKILGLEGAYTQLLIDNMPLMSGLNVKYGISSIPGTQIDKITISKGSNSVIQGYESISGIMNVILKDYNNSDRLMVNGFINGAMEKQFNVNFGNKISKNWSNMLTLHTVQKSNVMDHNGDGFLDNPLITRYVIYNKWNLSDKENKTEFNIAGRYWNENRDGGQKSDHSHGINTHGNRLYEQNIKINSAEGYSRFSKQFTETSGIKAYLTSSYYDQGSTYGITGYDAKQQIFSAMSFYEFEIMTRSYLKLGASYKFQKIDELIKFNDTTSKTYAGNYIKKESIPGVFAENSLSLLDDKASLMTGIRFDNHNTYGLIVTPRALFRYQPVKTLVFRASIGTGYRTINLFSEYSNLLASSRNIVVKETLNPEKTLNYGADVLFYFGSNDYSGSINVDFYRTEFNNKIIPDYDSNPREVIFENLNGRAFSNVLQAELNLTVLRNLELKLAYKFIDLKYDKDGVRYEQPFTAKHRVLTTVSYMPQSKSWSINAGLNWFGKQRLPSTALNPVEYQLPAESKPYTLINAQFNKNFKYFELYAGVENILDFKQDNPIIGANDPFGPYFDTSFIWGPTRGREVYAGFRFVLGK